MPEIEINIGGRSFEVACQAGEEHYLQAAARMLDTEASVLSDQIGRLPEARMLLMAGLMLADKTAGLEDRLRESEDKIMMMERELAAGAAAAEPERVEVEVPVEVQVEVPVVPEEVTQLLTDLSEKAEALASDMEAKLAAG